MAHGDADNRSRIRALLLGAATVAAVAVVDLVVVPDGLARLPVWGAFAGGFLVFAAIRTRAPVSLNVPLSVGSSVVAITCILGLARVSGGSTSTYFDVVAMIPLMTALVVPAQMLEALSVGAAGVIGGAAMLVAEGRPASEVVVWVTLVAVGTTFAVLSAIRHRRRREQLLAAQAERAEALERLAEAELARADAERWAAVGVVADQVAHDVASPLSSVRSSLVFVRAELPEGVDPELRAAVADALTCVDRICDTVAALRARAHPDRPRATGS